MKCAAYFGDYVAACQENLEDWFRLPLFSFTAQSVGPGTVIVGKKKKRNEKEFCDGR